MVNVKILLSCQFGLRGFGLFAECKFTKPEGIKTSVVSDTKGLNLAIHPNRYPGAPNKTSAFPTFLLWLW